MSDTNAAASPEMITGGTAHFGMVGLAVMGQNLVLNMVDNGYTVAVYNRTTSVTDDFVARNPDATLIGANDLVELAAALERPRKVMMLVKAGGPVDAVIGGLLEVLEPGDVIIDGGNSEWRDTNRRQKTVEDAGLLYVGSGVSGGEEGARHGPSMMPGGSPAAWPLIKGVFEAVAAEAEGEPCAGWLGSGGAGHFVKMVHNGIEYGDMQVLAETYGLMQAMGYDNARIGGVFDSWRTTELQSYLVDITADIFNTKEEDGTWTIDLILDAAQQKGTGKWTVIDAMESGQPVMLVAEAVGARMVSSFVELRAAASEVLPGPSEASEKALALTPDRLKDAVYAAKIVSYTQGFMLLADASDEQNWDLDMGLVAAVWREGCIIRARFLNDITAAYRKNPELANLMLDEFFVAEISRTHAGLRAVVAAAAEAGVAAPAMSSALAFYDGFRRRRGTANLIQGLRDYFGAHTYERVDRPRGEWFHTDWAKTGGSITSNNYNV